MRRPYRRGIVGIEAAIVLIAFVIVASAFAFMVVNMGLTSTQRSKEAIQQGLKEASCPLTLDGSMLLKSDPVQPNNVKNIIIPLKVLGVKYVPMWTNETVVSVKIGTKASVANIYAGINHDIDPTGMSLDEIIQRLTAVNETIVLTTVTGGTGVGGKLSEKPILPGSVTITVGDNIYTDGGNGTLYQGSTKKGSINYLTGEVTITGLSSDTTAVAFYKKIVNSVSVVGEKDSISQEVIDGNTIVGTITLDHHPVVPGSVTITVTITVSGSTSITTYTDNGKGEFPGLTGGSINYTSGKVTLGALQSGASGSVVSNYKYVVETRAVLVVENDNHDDSLDFFEKGYLIIELDPSQRAAPRDNVLIEIRPEKSAPLTIEFTVPEAIPANAYVTIE
jgi:flagellin-like protein